jgi:hypothetical protein
MSDFKSVKRSKADAARRGAKNRIFTFFGSKYMRKRIRATKFESFVFCAYPRPDIQSQLMSQEKNSIARNQKNCAAEDGERALTETNRNTN